MIKDEDTQDAKLIAKKDRALAVIAFSINTEHQIHIIDCTSPQDAWKNLEQDFEPKSRSRILQLKEQFVNIKLQTGESMLDYLNRLKIDDQDIVYSMLSGLPDSFDTLVMSFGNVEDSDFTSNKPTTCEPIQTASGNLQVEGVGNIHMKMYLDTGTQDVTLNDVLFVPQARRNLLSVSQTEDKGKLIKICNHKARVFNDNRVICVARNLNALYVIRDDFSRRVTVYFLKHKDQVIENFDIFRARAERETGHKIKRLRTDNGLEYCNKNFKQKLESLGIKHELTNSYSPQQNGVSERLNCSLLDMARVSMHNADLPQKFWAESVNCAAYIKNRSLCSALDNKVPEEIWLSRKVSVRHFKIFGALAYAHIPNQKRKKFDRRAKRCILVGYSTQSKGYRLWDNDSKQVFITKHARFDENKLIQRRGQFGNPKDYFNRSWDDYERGFGNLQGEFWLAIARVDRMTTTKYDPNEEVRNNVGTQLLRAPLNKLLKIDVKWNWNPDCQQAFITLKERLTSKPVLHLYQVGLPCRLYCDASTQGIAGLLKQMEPEISTYNYEIHYLKGSQQYEADLLSRNPFVGFTSADIIEQHQTTASPFNIDTNGLHTITRKGVTKIIIPETLQHTLMNKVHQEYNHPGISQMTRIITTQYYWKDLRTHLNPYPEINKAREIASSRNQNKHKKYKETFDKQHRTPHFEVNDLVLVKNYRHPERGN
ncbi:hypothetical protein LAZ67_3004496 [Cordylochernes scorpioides]|uniref:Integrase catalytic domain-containing protein n=1 Tax=Cordylochernes scorpioides TaxID=51811 RepID=A0ABY6K9H0_9ARAC|nr:hypothetical protein LAZ67_3004496 [Cordylochernes scorpioides]